MSKTASWGLLLLWVITMLAGLIYFGLNQLRLFDPNQLLAQAAVSQEFDQQFVNMLQEQGVEAGSVVHFNSDERCYCQTLVNPHVASLAASLPTYKSVNIKVSSDSPLGAVLPSTPAIAVIDQQGQLRYLGPYATGYGCFTGDDLTSYVSQLANKTPYLGAVINSEAEGCFCSLGD